MDKENIIVFVVILPIILFVVLGFAYFARKIKNDKVTSVESNIHIINNILNNNMHYIKKGKIPFQSISQDPSLHVNHANSCLCNHMLQGNYLGNEFVITNIKTMQSEGYGEVSNSIFSGVYILMNTNIHKYRPMYICSERFWHKFNHKGKLQFKVNNNTIYEAENANFRGFKLLQTHDDWNLDDISKKLSNELELIFRNSNYDISFFIHSDKTIGMAISNFKMFEFDLRNIININSNDNQDKYIQNAIYKDAIQIKYFLEQLNILKNKL